LNPDPRDRDWRRPRDGVDFELTLRCIHAIGVNERLTLRVRPVPDSMIFSISSVL
jgi:hypothetical protein